MRHSSITLMMDTYSHLFPGQEADAVKQLESVVQQPQAVYRATGTFDDSSAQLNAQQSLARNHATRGGLRASRHG
jgi:hypothetical protein